MEIVDGVRVHRLDATRATSYQAIREQRLSDGDVVVTRAVAAVVVGGHACTVTNPPYGLSLLTNDWETVGPPYAQAYRVACRVAEQSNLTLLAEHALLAGPAIALEALDSYHRKILEPTVAALTGSQRTTLHTIIGMDGEVNGYEDQPGMDYRSIRGLVRKRLLDSIGTCDCWETDGEAPCNIDHIELDTPWCYRRVRVTHFGAAIHARLIAQDKRAP